MTTLLLASAENWTMCDPHQLYLARAATVAPGTERAFIEAQIDAFSNRAHWLEQESQLWHGDDLPVQKTKEVGKGDTSFLADFVGEACCCLPRLRPGAGERIGVACASKENVRSV